MSILLLRKSDWEVLPDSCSDGHPQMLSHPRLLPQRACFSWVLLMRTKTREKRNPFPCLKRGSFPLCLLLLGREREREESMLDLLEAVVFTLLASSAA